MAKIKLGEKVKDIVSGFTGIATAKTIYLNGCVQYTVQQKQVKPMDDVKSMDVDEEQLKRVSAGILKKKKVTNTGGPKDFKMRIATKILTTKK